MLAPPCTVARVGAVSGALRAKASLVHRREVDLDKGSGDPRCVVDRDADLDVGVGTEIVLATKRARPLLPRMLVADPTLAGEPDARSDVDERDVQPGDGGRVPEEERVRSCFARSRRHALDERGTTSSQPP